MESRGVAAARSLHDTHPMILKFPDLDTLRLAITSGAAPPAVAFSAAVAGGDDRGRVWVETAAPLPRDVQNRLREIGVQISKAKGAVEQVAVSSWPEIMPLRADSDSVERLEQTPILFEIAAPIGLGQAGQ